MGKPITLTEKEIKGLPALQREKLLEYLRNGFEIHANRSSGIEMWNSGKGKEVEVFNSLDTSGIRRHTLKKDGSIVKA